MSDMLRLSPNDNLGKRRKLSTVLQLAGDCEGALSSAQAWIQDYLQLEPDGSSPPSDVPMTPEEFQQCAGDGFVEQYYTAALAAFTLWGNCELARQYLYIAARRNRTVLMKILARHETPGETFRFLRTTS